MTTLPHVAQLLPQLCSAPQPLDYAAQVPA